MKGLEWDGSTSENISIPKVCNDANSMPRSPGTSPSFAKGWMVRGIASATNTVKVYHVSEAVGLLIQPGHHFVFCEGFEAGRFEIETPGPQIRTNVLRNELLVEVNPDGEFYT
jgi:hypothetical protein